MKDLFRSRFFIFLLVSVSILDVFTEVSWALDKASENTTPVSATKASETSPEEELFKAGKFQETVDLLSPQIDKLSKAQLSLLGRAQSETKNHLAAIKTFSLILSKNPKDAETKVLIGNEQYLQGKDREAMITFREALDLDPKLEAAYLMIEKLYVKKNNKYELRMLYSDMVDRIGEKPEYITRLCELNTLSGIYDLAKAYCRQGITMQKDNAKNYVYLAMALKETGAIDEAKSLFKRAADNFTQSDDAQLGYAQFLDEQKNFLDSSKYYKVATVANPKSTKAWLGYAQSSLEIQKYQDALTAFTAACKIDRRSITQVKQALGILKNLKQDTWFDKYEALSETCGVPQDSESKN